MLVWGFDAILPIATDGRSILVGHEDKTLVLFDANGRVLWRVSAVPGFAGGAVQGRQIVALTRTSLVVWDRGSVRTEKTYPLPPARRAFEDLDGGIAVLGSHGTTHLIRLSDGRGVTFTHAFHAQLEPQGLYFSDGRTLRFVPRAKIHFG